MLARHDHRWLSRAFHPIVQVMLAGNAHLLGRPDECLRRLDAARPLGSRVGGRAYFVRVQSAGLRACALACLGRAEEAHAARAVLRELLASRAKGNAEMLQFFLQNAELDVAAALDAPDDLPDAETLHQWARDALGRTRFGEMLVQLAWAFDQRGDEAMARHLLAEAPSRVQRWSLPATLPRLWAWAVARQRAWDLPPLLLEPPVGPGRSELLTPGPPP